MSISDADFAAWLLADNKVRCVLAELDAYSGGSTVTRYISSLGFVSFPGDTPASTGYDDVLLEVPRIRSSMSEVLRGYSTISFGDLVVDNSSGALDAWLADAWDGQAVRLFLGDGDPANGWTKADFRKVFDGVIEDIAAPDRATIKLRVRDRQKLLDVPLLTTLVLGTDSTSNLRTPVCYGECKNVSPVLVDSGTRTYAFHDGAVQAVDAVYDSGVPYVGYTVNLGAGTISLTGADLTGLLTLDVKGSKTGGVYVNTTADIVTRLVEERAGFSSGNIDAGSVAALNADAPGVVGLYVSSDSTTILQSLDELLNGAGGYYAIDRAGKLFMAQFKLPAGSPVVTLDDDEMVEAKIALKTRLLPLKSVRVGYGRIYTTLSNPEPTISEAARQRLLNEYLVALATNTVTGHLLAVDGDLEPTLFLDPTVAANEATRRAALWSATRSVFSISGFVAAQQVRLGDVVALDLGCFGLTGGLLATVVGMNEQLTGGLMDLEVFL
jgi:hypothetical protein